MTTHAELAVRITGFVDSSQPGFVACEFVDADDQPHTFIDKAPVFTTETLDANSAYPQPGRVRCTELGVRRDARGRELITISTTDPDSVESVNGLSKFVVLGTQVSAVSDRGA